MKKFILVLVLLTCAFNIFASEQSAQDLLDKMEQLMDFDSAIMSMTMVNTDRLGSTSMVFTTSQKGNGDTILVVTEGPDKGQKILRLNNDIYIYYPDAEEVVRLSSSGLKNSFLGSDFSYEDLTGDDDYSKRFNSSIEATVEVDGLACYVVRLEAKKSSETYQLQKVYIAVDSNLPVKFEMYSKSGKLLKTMSYLDFVQQSGVWYPTHIKVINAVKKNSYSDITITDLNFNVALDESKFNKEELSW